jgi:hypothetical protein
MAGILRCRGALATHGLPGMAGACYDRPMRILLLILDGLVAYWALRAIDTAPGITARWPAKSQRAVISYVVFVLCGIVALFLLPFETMEDNAALYATGAITAWVFLGILWLVRATGTTKLPAWMLQPWGAADWVLIVLVIVWGTLAAVA